MVLRSDLQAITPYIWEIPRSYRNDMRVPARVYIDELGLEAILADESIEQLINVATLPGITGYALAMPDIHQGYGFPVGGIAAMRCSDGVISPGGIGYDINCGVRLLTTDFQFEEVKPYLERLATQLQRDIPSGVGRGGDLKLGESEMDRVLNTGMQWALKNRYASEADIEAVEEHGFYAQADAASISSEAKKRAADQLGTMGAGNHFVEVQRLDHIFDADTARTWGLFENQICIMIHTGSRGLGHQTCTDYVRRMNQVMAKYRIEIPDRELACAPFRSPEGQEYFSAMAAAANFAWVNRQLITHAVRGAFQTIIKPTHKAHVRILYDVSHNIAKLEEYGGEPCVVHRKGATRAFGPGRKELASRFQRTGQPVIIPGSMGTASYVLSGTDQAMQHTFGSCCHGAGRALSRMRAKKTVDYNKLLKKLESKGVLVRGASSAGLLEEAPEAYKDVSRVVEAVDRSGTARTIARLSPCAVVKG